MGADALKDKSAEISKRPHWMFFVYAYAPGNEKQSWEPNPDRKTLLPERELPKKSFRRFVWHRCPAKAVPVVVR